jgi:hypothetical protein
MKLLAILAAGTALALALAAPASAAPVASGSLSAAAPEFSWSGTAYGTNLAGEPCNTDHSCEDALLEIENAGTLAVGWTAAAPGGPAWLSVSVLKSDASGAEGEVLADGGGLEDTGSVTARLTEGYYLVRVAGLLTSLATYDATAKLKPKVVATTTPPAVAPETKAPAAKKKSCKKRKSKKARKRCRKKRKS